MEELEANFKLTRVVSLTALVDELKVKDSTAHKESKENLDRWLKGDQYAPVVLEDESTDEKSENKSINTTHASLSFATASFAVKFLKARQAKLAKKKLQEETEIRFENNNILPSTIPVEVYLESLQTLRSQKEHRRVDLLKEQRWKKAVKRRDVSMQRTITRLKQSRSKTSTGKVHDTNKKTIKPMKKHGCKKMSHNGCSMGIEMNCMPIVTVTRPKSATETATDFSNCHQHLNLSGDDDSPIVSPSITPLSHPPV